MKCLLFFTVLDAVHGLSISKKKSETLMMDPAALEEAVETRAKMYAGLRDVAMEKHTKTVERMSRWGHPHIIHVEVPQIDLTTLAREDVVQEAEGGAPRYAQRTHVTEGPALGGTWTQLSPDTLQWSFVASSVGATSMNLGFEHFQLPEGVVMTISSAEDQFKFHVTADDNKDHNQFWTPPIPGGHVRITVEMHTDHRKLVEDGIILSRINVGYRGFHAAAHMLDIGTPSSGACHYDAHCPEILPDWGNEIPCVAVFSTGGELFCTGALLNNVKQDLTPYFLTAKHCDVNATNAASLVTVWNYEDKKGEKLDCPGNDHDESYNFNWMSGSKHMASYGPTDMTLLKLDRKPPEEWKASYCGWSRSEGATKSSVVIHHPNTYHKRKSASSQPSWVEEFWIKIGAYDYGATEEGSSGAPLFNENKLVVGQLNGGLAACDGTKSNKKYDKFGRFSKSWWMIEQYLDPDRSGNMEMKTLSGIDGNGNPVDLDHDGTISKVLVKNAYGCGFGSSRMCNGKESCFETKNIGDGYCDGNDSEYGINACCYNWDGGDCKESQCRGTQGPAESPILAP